MGKEMTCCPFCNFSFTNYKNRHGIIPKKYRHLFGSKKIHFSNYIVCLKCHKDVFHEKTNYFNLDFV